MKDQVESKLKPVKKTGKEVIEDSDDSDDDTDVQDFVDWRNKCWYTQLKFYITSDKIYQVCFTRFYTKLKQNLEGDILCQFIF